MSASSDMTINLLTSFFITQFRHSGNFTLRLSLLYSDVRQENLLKNDFEALLSSSILSEDVESFKARLNNVSEKSLIYQDIHSFETFLYWSSFSGFEVRETPDSESFIGDDKGVEYNKTIYTVKLSKTDDVSRLVKNLVEISSSDDLIALLFFLLMHMEYTP